MFNLKTAVGSQKPTQAIDAPEVFRFNQIKSVSFFVLLTVTSCNTQSDKDAHRNTGSEGASANQTEVVKQRVIYHINYDNPKKQAAALHSIEHHLDATGKENIEIRVVLHGAGLSLLLEPDALSDTKLARANADQLVQARVSQLKDKGVLFNVCKNSLANNDVDYQLDLYDVAKADLVDNGISSIINYQKDGYMYLKP